MVAEFLADESVKSRLLSEQQWMASQKSYDFARAMEAQRFLRRLGAARDGLSFLDKLRQVLTQIGNCLGYVRMVRTAGMRSMAHSLEALEASPWLEDLGSSSTHVQLAESAARSAKRCFSASTDFLCLESCERCHVSPRFR